MARESVEKLQGPLPNQKMITSTGRASTTGITPVPGHGVEGLQSEYKPIRGDYPEVMLQHKGNRYTVTGPDYAGGAPIPVRKVRPTQYRKQADHWMFVSARSKRELRAILAASGAEIVHSIQVRDDGRYFVYADKGPGDPIAPAVAACDDPAPAQKLSDLPNVDDDCDTAPVQQVEDLPDSKDDDC